MAVTRVSARRSSEAAACGETPDATALSRMERLSLIDALSSDASL
jgi:hypothetical protein